MFTGPLEVRLSDSDNARNLSRLEVRQPNGHWGTICCLEYCSKETLTVGLTMDSLCELLGFKGFHSYSYDLETTENQNKSLSVHLELVSKVPGSSTFLDSLNLFGISNWSQPSCDSSNNVYLSCYSG